MDRVLLSTVMDRIETNPELLDQSTWGKRPWWAFGWLGSCRTTCCFAGTTVVEAGWELLFTADGLADDCRNPVSGEVRGIPFAARALLGLDAVEAGWLFYGAQNVEQLRAVVDELLTAPIVSLVSERVGRGHEDRD